MGKFKVIILICGLILFSITSCNGTEVPRREFVQYALISQETLTPDIKHKSWTIIEDSENCDVSKLLSQSKRVYKISHNHSFDKLVLPKGCEVYFDGGSLKGDITFDSNYLSGKVKLHESTLNGTIVNTSFEAGWICFGDGKKDDAKGINEALKVCNTIHFQKGTYLLSSLHQPLPDLAKNFHEAVNSHVGIFKSGISLIGDQGACLLSKDINRVITIYSLPNEIKRSIKNIKISGLTFRVFNNGKEFHEFVHTIKTLGVNGLSITNCEFFEFWGDAISLSHYGDTPNTGERSRNSHVIIDNNYIDGGNHNNRNGISIISGYDVIINNNTLVETSKDNMPGAIDVEANNSAYTTEKIVIQNNSIYNCKGNVGSIAIVSNKNEAPAKNIVIEGNDIQSSTNGICILIDSKNSTGRIKIRENNISNCNNPLIFRGNGESKNWEIKGNKYNNSIKSKIGGNIQVTNLKTDRKK